MLKVGRFGIGQKVKTKMGKTKGEICMGVVKEDMQEVGARKDEVFDRSVRRIRCGPQGKI